MSANPSEPAFSTRPYAVSIALAVLSLATMLLILPPMFWHFRNRNIGATSFIFWIVLSLFFTFINATLWPNDNFGSWYNGAGLCDVEVKIQNAIQIALPASFACVLRALAAVLDTDRLTLSESARQKRRRCILEILCCFGLPVLEMLFQLVVQSGRYYIFSISGCAPIVKANWLTFLLLYVPPIFWTCVDAFFAILILYRLWRYRLTFSTILATSNTTKSRFLRLYLICVLWLLFAIPSAIYSTVRGYNDLNSAGDIWSSFNWREVHENAWTEIIYVHGYGHVPLTSWLPLFSGVGIFIFFGFGRDAVAMYRAGLSAVGLGCCFRSRREAVADSQTANSLRDKVKRCYKSKSLISTSTWSIRSSRGPLSPAGPSSPDTMRYSRDLEKAVRIHDERASQIKALSPTESSRRSDMDIALEVLDDDQTTLRGDA